MMALLHTARNRLIKALEWSVIILFALLVIDVLWGVVSRICGGTIVWLSGKGFEPWHFLPRGQTRWTEEAAIFLLMWLSLLGAAVAYGEKAHLGLDYLVEKLHIEARPIADILAHALSAFFAFFVLIAGGYELVSETLAANQLSPALQVKIGYIYLAVPISGLFILFFALENIFTKRAAHA